MLIANLKNTNSSTPLIPFREKCSHTHTHTHTHIRVFAIYRGRPRFVMMERVLGKSLQFWCGHQFEAMVLTNVFDTLLLYTPPTSDPSKEDFFKTMFIGALGARNDLSCRNFCISTILKTEDCPRFKRGRPRFGQSPRFVAMATGVCPR